MTRGWGFNLAAGAGFFRYIFMGFLKALVFFLLDFFLRELGVNSL